MWSCAALALLVLAAGDPPPNIVVFLVDDLGWQDTSVPFHESPTELNARYHTPAMERLAEEGVKFTSAYAAGPVCTPSRTSLLTGQAPARTNITYWTLYAGKDTSARHDSLVPPAWDLDALQPDDLTLPRLLHAAGYRAIHVGKAHLGAVDSPGGDPMALGFDVNVAGHGAGGPGSYRGRHRFKATRSTEDFSRDSVWDVPGLEAYHNREIFLTEALAIEACAAIDAAVEDAQPFFLHFATYAVHTPIMPNPRHLDRYEGLDPREAAYATMIESADAALGAVLDRLDALGIADRTLVIFTSDNGGLSAHGRGGEPHTHNRPLRSGKGSVYEGGIRVPMIFRWAGRASPGTTCAAPVITHDLFPTILAAARTEVPLDHDIDGRDLAPLLDDDPFAVRLLGWHQPHQWGARGPGIEPFTAIRLGRWKLIYMHADERLELYDLVDDIGESNDLAAARPEITSRLAEKLRQWCRDVGAQSSIRRATGQPVPWPDLQADPLPGDGDREP